MTRTAAAPKSQKQKNTERTQFPLKPHERRELPGNRHPQNRYLRNWVWTQRREWK
jgi:hypothetical protein